MLFVYILSIHLTCPRAREPTLLGFALSFYFARALIALRRYYFFDRAVMPILVFENPSGLVMVLCVLYVQRLAVERPIGHLCCWAGEKSRI